MKNNINAFIETYNTVTSYVDCELSESSDKIVMPIYDNIKIEFSFNAGKYKARLLEVDLPGIKIDRSLAFDTDINLLALFERVFESCTNIDYFYKTVINKAKAVRSKDVYKNVKVHYPSGRTQNNVYLKDSQIKALINAGCTIMSIDRNEFDRMRIRGRANKKALSFMYKNTSNVKMFV